MQILGHEYSIERRPAEEVGRDLGESKAGKVDIANHAILVATELDEQEAVATLVHEMVEIWNHRMNIRLTHHQIALVDQAIFDCLGELNYQRLAKLLTQEKGQDRMSLKDPKEMPS